MGLDVWFRPDVSRILGATYEAMQATAAAGAGGEQFESYRQGFGAALRAIAAGFGLPDPATTPDNSYERGPEPLRRAAEPAAGYQLGRESAAAPQWRTTPADDRQWLGQVVDGEVTRTSRACP